MLRFGTTALRQRLAAFGSFQRPLLSAVSDLARSRTHVSNLARWFSSGDATPRARRNVAVIAHVDHGKTTLVDRLLVEAGAIDRSKNGARVMDSNALEKERGITIMAKQTSAIWRDTLINIVDTPGHADFGGEVERVLSMVEGCILVVDATEGVMPQTKFVVGKALKAGLKPILLLNKMDRDTARPEQVQDEIFELLFSLGATEAQLDYPTVLASATAGWSQLAGQNQQRQQNMSVVLDAIVRHVPAPKVDLNAPFALSVTNITSDDFFGRIASGRVASGRIAVGDAVKSIAFDDAGNVITRATATIVKLLTRRGTEQISLNVAEAGDIVGVAALDRNASVTDTITSAANGVAEPLACIKIDPPVLSMTIRINDSPLAGKEGTQHTGQAIGKRLEQELENNPSLQVVKNGDAYEVKGRGELQLGILIENMRREGFELSVSPPTVIFRRDADNKRLEPIEELVIDCDSTDVGKLIDVVSKRRGDVVEVRDDSASGKSRMRFSVPARGLIGFQREFQVITRGTGIMAHVHLGYEPLRGPLETSRKGALISMAEGKATTYALLALEPRGVLFVAPGDPCYGGMIVGEHSRELDLEINPTKAKQLTNIRSVAKDETVRLTPPVVMSLEQAIAWIRAGEVIEITPKSIRLRMQSLEPGDRKKDKRSNDEAFNT